MKNLLYKGKVAIVKAITENTVELTKSLQTSKMPFVVEVLESALPVLVGVGFDVL